MKRTLQISALLFACLLTGRLYAQERGVSGAVTGPEGEGLPGVTVQVKGTTSGTITDIDGGYNLTVPSDESVLVYSFIGLEKQEITVGGRSVIDVQMSPDSEVLEEIVVVGYGTQQREAVTGSVVSIEGKDIRSIPAANISTSLQGRLPGVQISQTSSEPGTTMQIRIRGVRSLTASNDPLIVLNGIPFPGNLNDIDPNDIESVDILKDASASAIYGSRGANGVILVTTSKGKKGDAPRISYNTVMGMKKAFSRYPMMDGEEFVQLRQDAGRYTESGEPGGVVTFGADESATTDTDWQDLFYKDKASFSSHNIGVSGGTSSGSYNFGVGYFHDESLVPTQAFDRYSLRASLDQNIGDFINVGFSTNSLYSLSQGNQVGVGFANSATPISDPFNADGTTKRTISQILDNSYVLTEDVIDGLGGLWVRETRNLASYNTLYGEINIPWVEGLKFKSNLGVNYRQRNEGSFTGRGVVNFNAENLSSATVDNQHTYDWTAENMMIYDRDFSGHHINVIGMYSASQRKYHRSNMNARDIPAEAFQFYNLGEAAGDILINPGNQRYELWGLLSYMGRVQYEYRDKYMLTATVRSDGSSRLADGNKWHTYPAISAGWNIGNENFMSGVSALNRLKLRVGYGQTANQSLSPYQTLGTLSSTPYNHGPDGYVTGFFVSALPNPNVGWEYSETLNVGVDFALLDNRLSGTMEYYVTNTKDLLLNVSLPETSGSDRVLQNIGETQNKGIELTLNGVIVEDANGWSVNAGLNFYRNKNTLMALADGSERDEGNWWFVGHSINVIYDYERIGMWQEGDEHMDILEPEGHPGMIKVQYNGEYNEDGTPARAINSEDRVPISQDPNFQGGFNIDVGYKNFDFSIIGAYQAGGILVSTLYGPTGRVNLMDGRNGNVKIDYWSPSNTDAKYPDPGGFRDGDNLKYAGTLAYFDASYMKVRAMTLAYNFESLGFLQDAGFDKLRLYVTAQNPFVMFSEYNKESGLDPETNSRGRENQSYNTYRSRTLVQAANAPQTRNYFVGLNLTF
ncbi:MAG: TonB-dependent receptor [Cyclobacteriaceae bacterium]